MEMADDPSQRKGKGSIDKGEGNCELLVIPDGGFQRDARQDTRKENRGGKEDGHWRTVK